MGTRDQKWLQILADRKILIDTSVFIEYFRKKDKTKSILFKLVKEENILLTSSVCYFEYKAGSKDKDFDNILFSNIKILPFDIDQAQIASEIFKDLKKKNILIEFRDIFIASCALSHDIVLSTLNNKHFKRIDKLQLL